MKLSKALFWVSFFAIAMGYLESSVVVYLRAIFYPEGFSFPLAMMDNQIAITEIFREAATLIMLLGIGIIAGRNSSEKFAWFLYSFAVWDIFYYVFLKLLLNWPESFMTWDILFLIPVTWVGPVIAPVITSFTMIAFALVILYVNQKNKTVRISMPEWMLLTGGSLILIVAFTWDYSRFMLQHYSFSQIWTIPKTALHELATKYIPVAFNWWLFLLGEVVILLGIIQFWRRNNKAS
ncbi:MAG TPA: hypothetical protein VHO90_00690 [Bacteroidales bacterium]|nr:hypothetical protein [Bacteroidales bacterium]